MTTETGFSSEEKAAMKQAAFERRRKGKTTPAEDLAECMEAIDKMNAEDKTTALKLHEILMSEGPDLAPKTWYGMPAYQINGKVICFFQNAGKFKTRYHTLGFTEHAALDTGEFWPNAYALLSITPEVEAQIRLLVRRALS